MQNAVRDEYLPLLSELLVADGMIAEPLQAVIRKGKSHYVCEERLEQRLGQLDLSRKNWQAGAALLSLRGQLDMSEAPHLSHYDQERVCVPHTCDCQRESCRYNREGYVFCQENGQPYPLGHRSSKNIIYMYPNAHVSNEEYAKAMRK